MQSQRFHMYKQTVHTRKTYSLIIAYFCHCILLIWEKLYLFTSVVFQYYWTKKKHFRTHKKSIYLPVMVVGTLTAIQEEPICKDLI